MYEIIARMLDEHTDGGFKALALEEGFEDPVAFYAYIAFSATTKPHLITEQPKVIGRLGLVARVEERPGGKIELFIEN